ncbi:MAG: hypothetical protein C4523_02490 [Myxococcales bacterium]|nr:MAG: hypothetical protein C4523_02490 [Myxococcales bacterium]
MTTFRGPLYVRAKADNGIPAQSDKGTVILEQMVSLAADTSGASSIVLPANSRIVDMNVVVITPATLNTQGILVRVGTTSDAIKFANIKTSASNIYRCGYAPNLTAGSVAAWHNIGTGSQRLYIDVTAAASAAETAEFTGLLSIQYVLR